MKVRYVDVPVLDHGSKGGFNDGFVELVFDLMEFGVAHAEASAKDMPVSSHIDYCPTYDATAQDQAD